MRLSEAPTKIGFKNVLFATDFSPVSRTALPFAESVARRYGSKLIAAHAISPGETRMVPTEAWGACQQAIEDGARQEMNGLDVRLTAIPHEVVIRHGMIWDVLSELIEEKDADLLIMGTHGRSGIGRLLMGSVAEEVFRQVAGPVLTIGPGVAAHAAPQAEFKEIVFATDFSLGSLAAAPYALSLAQEFQARLTLVHVVAEAGELVHGSAIPECERILADLRAIVPLDAEMWCRPECDVRFGVPAAGILEVAAEKRADLIVLGVRSGHVGAATHALAATAHSVLSCAPCPVLTVRERRA